MPRVTVNGESRQIEEASTIADLLRLLNLSGEGLAVEVNREIVPRRLHTETRLRAGDEIEIVTFVGGG